MNKIINWIGGSFFRTIGRILVYILLGFLLSYLLKDVKLPSLFYVLKPLNVYADEDIIKIYDRQLTFNNFVVVPVGNSRVINISGGNVYGDNGNGQWPPEYYIGTFCTDSNDITSWQGTSMSGTGGAGSTYSNTLTQLNFYNTGFSCMFPNSTYTGGHIVYIYGKINPIWNVSGTSATLMGRITYNQPNQSSWALLSWSWSNDSISIDYSSNTLITQNTTIINQNTEIINKQQQLIDKQTATNEKLDDLNDTLNDDDTSQAATSASNFFSNFTTNQHGLTGIITAPLTAIQSLTSSTCADLVLPLPFVNQNLTLPCMRPIYNQHFGGFMQLYDIITLGIISYWVMVRIFALVKDFKNPEHDEIEVVDL